MRLSAALAVQLLVWCLALAGAANAAPCNSGGAGPSLPRRVLQQADPDLDPIVGSVPNVGEEAPFNYTTSGMLETVQVEVVRQECLMISGSFYSPLMTTVRELRTPEKNLQPTTRDCCISCLEREECNAWQWCESPEGCQTPVSNVSFPHQGCQLLDMAAFLGTNFSTHLLKEGSSLPFVAGSPVRFSVPKISGYDVEAGKNLGTGHNFSCADSIVPYYCIIEGNATEAAARCDAEEICTAFVYYPHGRDGNSSAVASLKAGALSEADTQLNPFGAIYFKLPSDYSDAAVAAAASESAASAASAAKSSSTDVIVIATVVPLAVLVGGAVAMGLMLVARQRKQRVRQTNAGKPASSDADEEAGSASGAGAVDDVARGSGEMEAALERASSGSTGEPASVPGSARKAGGTGSESPPSVVEVVPPRIPPELSGALAAQLLAAAGSGGGRGGAAPGQPGSGGQSALQSALQSPFMLLSPQDLAAMMAAQQQQQQQQPAPWPQPQAPWPQQPGPGAWSPPPQQQQQLQLGQALGGGGGGAGGLAALPAVPADVVVSQLSRHASSVLRSLGPDVISGSATGTARDLLETFARMYSQRPAVDYEQVAQLMDCDLDQEGQVAAEAAEDADIAALHGVVSGSERGGGSRGSSAPPSSAGMQSAGSAGASASASAAAAAGVAVAAGKGRASLSAQPSALAQQQEQEQQQQQQEQRLEDPGSLLPGMSALPYAMMELPWSDWSIQPEEVQICRRNDGTYWQLGSGAFGTVYKGLYHGVQLVAVKVLHRLDDARRTEDFQREVLLLKNLRDRNIVQFLGACLDGPAAMLVTEYMEFGDLWRALPLINASNQRIFGWYKRGRRVLLDVARGLNYLHAKRVVHLDLKSANILLSRHGTAKIADIGMARVLNREYLSVLSGLGTFAWSAPELISGKRCTEKVDMYSFGVVLWEVCTGDVPVRGSMRSLVPGVDCPPAVVLLHERCCAEDPGDRPSAKEVVEALTGLLLEGSGPLV